MNSSCVLFDFDGVIIDSRPSMEKAWDAVRDELKLEIEFKYYLEHVGKPFPVILTNLGIPVTYHKKAQLIYGVVAAKEIGLIKTYKGMHSVLRKLRSSGKALGIVTSKEYWRADYIIDILNIHVDVLITPEFTREGKPSGLPLFAALDKLAISASDAIYVGDMESDCQSAMNASMRYIHADWGYGKKPVKALSVSCPAEILDVLG
jgi:phosphoglycolate phosphatase-like HAD superfamily hydrolase